MPKLSLNCIFTAITCFLLLLVLPIKLTILLMAVYAVVRMMGVFKYKFPNRVEGEGESAVKTVFVTMPTFADGTWYIFCYLVKSTDGVKTKYSLPAQK